MSVFENEQKDNSEIVNWCCNNSDKLDFKETMIMLSAFEEMAQKLRPIYEKHNTKKFTLRLDK